MAPPRKRYTCGSNFEHGQDIQDDVRHYFGCLKTASKQAFFDSIPEANQQRIRDEQDRIRKIRARFEAEGAKTKAGRLLLGFKKDFNSWRRLGPSPDAGEDSPQNSKGKEKDVVDEVEDDLDLKASVIWYKSNQPYSHPKFPDEFPNQKHSLHKLLFEKDEAKNPLMIALEEDEFRWIHIPANNMHWVEEAVARYYHEDRPELSLPFEKPKRHEASKAKMLLRPQFWRGLQHGSRPGLPVHTRHMRPRCYDISINPNSIQRSQNLVFFAPFLHWDTDRRRDRAAKIIRSTMKSDLSSMSQVVEKATTIINTSEVERRTTNDGWETVTTRTKTRPVSSRKITPFTIQGQTLLGQVLLRAAALKEHMDFNTDEKLLRKYINHDPPLHPRRTLDQFYYWTLKDTQKRDRDQVVYRATNYQPDILHHFCQKKDKKKDQACKQCTEDICKVPRIIMVDSLWMWILDSKTIITAFPKRLGRNKPDPSAVQKCIRTRLENARDDEIRSVFDLAIVIIDQCSRVFFDRTQPADQQPLVMDNFANAIGKVTAHCTIAYEHFWEYTRLASAKYNAKDREETAALQKTLLDINPEGKLLREIKDISEELFIMMLIKTQQRDVIRTFIKQIRKMTHEKSTLTGTPRGSPRPSSRHSDTDATTARAPSFNSRKPTFHMNTFEEDSEWTMTYAEDLMESIFDQLAELNDLKQAAEHTEAALKDLLGLKQQQAGVIEAREAVKQAEHTLSQGRSIVLFTIVTIIFLPLGFFSSIFGMNAAEINDSKLTLREEFAYMIPISFIVICISLLLAFSNFTRALISSPIRIFFTYIVTKTGLYATWQDHNFDSGWIKKKERHLVTAWQTQSKRDKLQRNVEKLQEQVERAMEETVTSTRGRRGGAGTARFSNGNIDVENLRPKTFPDVNGIEDRYRNV